MRILYITNGFPYPLTSGYLRHYFLIRELSRRHAITLLALVPTDFDPTNLDALAPFVEEVRTFRSSAGSRSVARKALRRLRALVPIQLPGPAVELGRVAAALAASRPFDVVLVSGKATYPALAAVPDLPVVADLCDAASSRVRASMRYARPWRLPFVALEYLQIRRTERRLVRRADRLLFASPHDRDELLREDGEPALARAAVVPNGVDLDYWRRSSPALGVDSIVFTGAMDYRPNEDAALHLVRDVMPLVWRSVPSAVLSIVGRDPRPAVVALGRLPNVTVTGFVEDVRPYLDGASLFAAPLRFGAGIQNKVLEAMAMEVPVVASPIVARGLSTEDGAKLPVEVAADAEGFARAVVERLLAARSGATPDRAARRYVERRFVWRTSGERLEAILVETAAPGQGQPREAEAVGARE